MARFFAVITCRNVQVGVAHTAIFHFHQLWIPQVKNWRLNERHYGELQGLDKKATAEKYGEKQVHIWRRSYNTLPPLLDPKDPNSIEDRKSVV